MASVHLDTRSDNPNASTFDQLTRYIRVRSKPEARFVEFDFAIGDPALFVELVMPQGAFEHFCTANQVVHMDDAQMAAVDAEMTKWRYGEDTLMAHNHDHHAAELQSESPQPNNNN